jgi:hypothetical protein
LRDKVQVEIGVCGRATGDLWLKGRIERDLFIYLPQHCRSCVKGVPDIVVHPYGRALIQKIALFRIDLRAQQGT